MPSETEAILNAHLCAAEDEVESLKAELQAERERTRVLEEALVEAVIPLEVIAGDHRSMPYRELSPELLAQIDRSIDKVRSSLAAGPSGEDTE